MARLTSAGMAVEPPLGGRRGSVPRRDGGELAGVAVWDQGHGEAEVGQGLGLMAVEVRQELVPHLRSPGADHREGAHGSAPGRKGFLSSDMQIPGRFPLPTTKK